ncbi:holo-ACP synthase [bacterium]|nr:holo-ACP synthase [bacterium]
MPGSVGVDIVKVSRIRDIIKRRGTRFVERYFSAGEFEYSSRKSNPYPHLAARFAAKEAAYKAFSSAGLGEFPLSSFDVHVHASGVPTLRFSEDAAAAANGLGSGNISLSLSHDGDYAVAVVALFETVTHSQ